MYQLVLCVFVLSFHCYIEKTLLLCIFQFRIGFCLLHLRLFLFRVFRSHFLCWLFLCVLWLLFILLCVLWALTNFLPFPGCLLFIFLLFHFVGCRFLYTYFFIFINFCLFIFSICLQKLFVYFISQPLLCFLR